jgi:hypothetical protein
MPKKLPPRDPGAAYRRKAVAKRRVGIGTRCACGEERSEALITGTKPSLCAACKRIKSGHPITDKHHFAGRANNPTTIPVPVNDHRACLGPAQEDWPKLTLKNPLGSPLLAGAACVRGFVDTVLYLMEKGLIWIAEMLEKLDDLLMRKLGSRWWLNSEIEQYAPKGKSNGSS